jgi:hypothetical protein
VSELAHGHAEPQQRSVQQSRPRDFALAGTTSGCVGARPAVLMRANGTASPADSGVVAVGRSTLLSWALSGSPSAESFPCRWTGEQIDRLRDALDGRPSPPLLPHLAPGPATTPSVPAGSTTGPRCATTLTG